MFIIFGREEFPYFRSAPDGWKVQCISVSKLDMTRVTPPEFHPTQLVTESGIPQGRALDEVARKEGFLLGSDSREESQCGKGSRTLPEAGGKAQRNG